MLEIANAGQPRGRLSPFHVKLGRDKRPVTTRRRAATYRDRVRAFDALASAASGIARSSTHRARQATRLALGVTAAMVLASATSALGQPPPRIPCGDGGVVDGGGGGGGELTASELTLSRRIVMVGGTLEGEVTLGNTSSAPIVLAEVRIAARAPGASHADGPYTDLVPALTKVTIPAGGRVTLAAARAFKSTDTTGRWEAYATYQDADGWHDLPSEYFLVRASSSGGGGGAGSGGGGDDKRMPVGTQAWFIASWAGTDYFRAGVNWSRAYADGVDIWNPQLLAELQGYAVWRHMDSNAVNWSKIERWSQRKLPTDPRNQEIYIDGSSPPDTTGLAVEWQIDLCNRAHVACWFTHPFLADDQYITEQAKLIKAKLDPSRTVYIELSNEVWNGSFSAYSQAISAGQALGVPGDNQYYQGISYEMIRALEMYAIYESVFGAAAMGSRVVRVFSESGNLDLTTQALRDVYTSSRWNPHGQSIDMIALAPYIGHNTDGKASDVAERWYAEVDDVVRGDISYALDNHVEAYDVPIFGCYEGGMHHTKNADAWARNPDVYDAYTYMFAEFAQKMTGPCVVYTLHGTWDSGGAWGLYDHVGQALSEAPKARATRDWIAGAPTTSQMSTRSWVLIVLFVVVLIAIGLYLYRIRLHRQQFEARLAERFANTRGSPPPPPPPTDDGAKP